MCFPICRAVASSFIDSRCKSRALSAVPYRERERFLSAIRASERERMVGSMDCRNLGGGESAGRKSRCEGLRSSPVQRRELVTSDDWRGEGDESRGGRRGVENSVRGGPLRNSAGCCHVNKDNWAPLLLALAHAVGSFRKNVECALESLPSDVPSPERFNTKVRLRVRNRKVLACLSQTTAGSEVRDLGQFSEEKPILSEDRDAGSLETQLTLGSNGVLLSAGPQGWAPETDDDSLTPHVLESRAARNSKSPLEFGALERKGWTGQMGQARVLYKHISVMDRARIGAMAGGLAGAFTYACLHPLDTVRTKLQTRGARDLYKGAGDVVVSILKTRGIFGFYSGISAVLVGSMLSSAVYFGTCELGKSVLFQLQSCPPLMVPPAASAVGNIVSSAILVPKDVITQRMQAGAAGRSWEVFLRTIKNEGLGGLYSGYSAAVVRNLPSSVLSFTTFEYMKAIWLKRSEKKSLEPWQSVSSGAIAGALSAALTTPLDVVKTRLMTQARSAVMGPAGVVQAEVQAKVAAASYKGITSTLRQIWLEEGMAGLTRGMGPRLLHSALFSALGYFAFETARLALVKQHMAKLQSSQSQQTLDANAVVTDV